MEIWKNGNLEKWKFRKIWKFGKMEIAKNGILEKLKLGKKETWINGN